MELDVQICETVASGERFWRDAPRGIALGSGERFRVERPSRIGLRWRQFRRSEHRCPKHDGNSSILKPTVQTVACFEPQLSSNLARPISLKVKTIDFARSTPKFWVFEATLIDRAQGQNR